MIIMNYTAIKYIDANRGDTVNAIIMATIKLNGAIKYIDVSSFLNVIMFGA